MTKSFFYITICSVLFCTNLWSQDLRSFTTHKEPVDYRFYYEHSHIRDTANRDSVHKEDMVLFVGKSSALFASFKKLQESKYVQDKTKELNLRIDEPMDMMNRPIVIPQEYLTFFDQNYFITCDYYARHYWYLDSLPTPDWIIHSDNREIQGLSCFRAEADIAGRHWEVWFTPDFAVPTGPWLLRGLPGLIVEAQDREREVSYALSGYEGGTVENPVLEAVKMFAEDYSFIHITTLKRRLHVNKADFEKLPEKVKRIGMGKYFSMQGDAMFEQGLVSNIDVGLSNYYSWMGVIRNPIDLR